MMKKMSKKPVKKVQKTKKGSKHAGGRPTKMTTEVIAKLEQAFAVGASDTQACFYAEVSVDALYKYIKKNPKFGERKEALKDNPVLKAKKTLVDNLDNPENARWYLERKLKKEFSIRQEITGEEGGAISVILDK